MGWIAVVLNQSSGSSNRADAAKRLEAFFADAGREARITVARSGGELRAALERAVEEGCASLVVGGGDGTINAGASAVIERQIPLGVLPMGTLNHFAKDLGIPLDLEEAARLILEGAQCTVDVGTVNGRIFLNNSSIGVYPAIVRLRERYQATGWGKWVAALWAGLAVLRRNPFMAVRIMAEGQAITRRTPFVFVGNNPYQMVGLHAGTRESLVTGHLAVYVFNAERRVGLLAVAWNVLIQGVDKVQELDLLEVEEATIETRRRQIQVALDGEVLSITTPLLYRTRARSLQVFVPRTTSACYPVDSPSSCSR